MLSPAAEDALVEYIQSACDIYFGLTPAEIRCLAFSFGKELKLKLPSTWVENEKAGKDWFSWFSIARASGFNKHTVAFFFGNLNTVMNKYDIGPGSIWNNEMRGYNRSTSWQNCCKTWAEANRKNYFPRKGRIGNSGNSCISPWKPHFSVFPRY